MGRPVPPHRQKIGQKLHFVSFFMNRLVGLKRIDSPMDVNGIGQARVVATRPIPV